MRAKCKLDCFHCPYDDCINDGELDNAVRCASWYDRNRDKKLAYQREYQRRYRERKRLEKTEKKSEPIIKPKEVQLLKFSELGALTEV